VKTSPLFRFEPLREPHDSSAILVACLNVRDSGITCRRLNCHRSKWPRQPEAQSVSWLMNDSLTPGTDFAETTTYDMLRESECTSCQFSDDKSAYW